MVYNLGMGFDPQRMNSQVIAAPVDYAGQIASLKSAQNDIPNFLSNTLPGAASSYASPSDYQAAQKNYDDGFARLSNFYNQQIAATQQQSAAANQNHDLLQQAYNQSNGGGFTGGLLNSSYAQPFSNTLTGNPFASSSGLMGGTPPATTPSAGQGASGWAASPQGADAHSWGGPFSVKNPWSLG